MSNINPLLQMDPLTSTSTIPGYTTSAAAAAAPDSDTNPLSSLADNTQDFLQLLVAQLQYQDPLNPVSGTAFLSQTAQMMEASQMTELVDTIDQQTSASETASATSLIGMQVTGTDPSGNSVTGVVTSVSVNPTSGPTLNLTTANGADSMALSSVTEVSPAS